jgi:hypothetical protein
MIGIKGWNIAMFMVWLPSRRISTVVVQRFCKPKVAGSNPASGTITGFS